MNSADAGKVMRLACVVAIGLSSAMDSVAADERLAQVVAELRAIAVTEEDPTTVPKKAADLQGDFKAALAKAVQEVLASAPPSTDDLPFVVKRLDALATSLAPAKDEPDNTTSLYGYVLGIRASRPAQSRDVLAVTITVRVPCGEDTTLRIFARRDARWETILVVDSGPYKDIGTALGRFQFGVSPHAGRGPFYVVTASINPWCTSWWQRLSYVAYYLRPGRPPEKQLTEEQTVYLGVDEPVYRLVVEESGFSVSFHGEEGPELDVRKRSITYAFGSGRVYRAR